MTAVSNSSTLINLGRTGMLWVLRDLFGQIPVPDAVWYEVVEEGAGSPRSDRSRGSTGSQWQTGRL